MSNVWKIMRAAVEQEILFPSRKAYNDYIDGLERKGMPFEVIAAEYSDNGTVLVLMRKRYNPQNAFLKSQPAGDRYTQAKHGRWIAVPSSDMMTGKAYKCSECNKMRYGSFFPNYCQNCGARMDGGADNGG